VDSKLSNLFSDIRSESTSDHDFHNCDAEIYASSSILERAYPERFGALLVTLLLELPVAFIITGGSAQICNLIGQVKYTLLLALLPLVSAISGNVGLQASTLTTRAISHYHVTRRSYWPWLLAEVSVGFLLSVGISAIVASIAFYLSSYDIGFALTLLLSQMFSILVAGFTGCVAPLVFTLICEKDAGKWAGPLETAVQDLAGTCSMIYLSRHVLAWAVANGLSPGNQAQCDFHP
jgi:magnesium transporter